MILKCQQEFLFAETIECEGNIFHSFPQFPADIKCPGWPRAFDIRWELRERMKDIPLAFYGFSKEEFLLALKNHDLPGNAQYGFGVSSLDEAKQIMDQILRYKALR